MVKIVRAVVLLLLAAVAAQARPKSLFYMTRDPGSVRAFLAHADKVDIVVPTWYHVDGNGLVWGGPNPLVLKAAKEHHVPVMPIVSAPGFGIKEFHAFLHNAAARKTFADALPAECKRYGYSGFQIDFEHLSWTDRDALSSMVAQTAAALHRHGYQLSIATSARTTDYAGHTGHGYWSYRDWIGVFDFGALARSVDLICLMTYDEHGLHTPPGPVAGYPWVVHSLDFALKSVPRDKLALGIPLYGKHWHAAMPKHDEANVAVDYISEPDAMLLARDNAARVQWDPVDRTSWFFFYRDSTREWVFFTDARTFEARYDLVKERGLEGFCAWVLGMGDPGIWKLLPSHK